MRILLFEVDRLIGDGIIRAYSLLIVQTGGFYVALHW